jgi:hypothetical protein
LALIDLDSAIDSSHEPQAREEPDGPGQHGEGERHHAHVREVQHGANQTIDRQLRKEIPDRIQKQVHTGKPRRQVRSAEHNTTIQLVNHMTRTEFANCILPPPPTIVFIAELEVDHHNADLRAGHHKDQQHNEQEAEHHVQLHRRKEHDVILGHTNPSTQTQN